MKKVLLSLFLGCGLAFGVTTSEVKLMGNSGGSQPVMRPLIKTDINLDTSEVDTSTLVFSLVDLPMSSFVDTLGQVFMRCDDSAGTDSVGGLLKWQGNPRADGKAIWENIDSVTIAVASGVETQTSKVVVNSKRYQMLRFILRNQLLPGGSAAEKTVCRDLILNRQRRLVD